MTDTELVGRQPEMLEMLAALDCFGWDEEHVDLALLDRGLPVGGSLEQKRTHLSKGLTGGGRRPGWRRSSTAI